MVAPLSLPVGYADRSVKVHPTVLYTICDAYIRRNEGQRRVIGALLGTTSDGVVEVKSCYAVPHSETNDQVALDVQHHQTMAGLHQRVSPREGVVGWFSTDADVSGSDALIQSFFSNEADSPVLLSVDAALSKGELTIQAYMSQTVSVQGRELARKFQQVPCTVMESEVEAVGSELLATESALLAADPEGEVLTSLQRLRSSLAAASSYVDAVVAGKVKGDVRVGRELADAVGAVPRFTAEEFESSLASSQSEVLITLYFANLIRAHVALADKLGTMELPLM